MLSMPNTPNRLAVERVQWLEVLPVLRLGSAFKQALQPGKLIVALLAVFAIHLSGSVLDLIWGEPVEYLFGDAGGSNTAGVYEALVREQAVNVQELLQSTLALDLLGSDGWGVFEGVRAIVFATPASFFTEHPWFMLLFGIDVLFVLMVAGGSICRMSATQVCLGKLTSLKQASRFVAKRWVWYLLTPLMPILLAVVLAGVLMLAGLAFFNLPVLDVIGSLIYGLLLLIGFAIALIGFVLIFALLLMPPAMSVEGTDGFDAVSRAFNYVMYRPWQFAGYLVGSMFYLAVVYVIAMALVGSAVWATYTFVDVGAFAGAEAVDVTRYDVIAGHADAGDDADAMVDSSAWLVARWLDLLSALVLALMFSVACSMQTQVYVLLRRSADGTPLDDCAQDDEVDPWSSPADMVDPAAQAIADAGPKGHPGPEATPVADSEPPSTTEG